eukprot:gnl/TRDRNA2_/TRDRNA2_128955_c0_seq2.p1 gnl/TRDRNA2_/TRDRNA2_128955_c0~~gnl/TRDRNA2_/TRDRNA2_128955_c0_seq2.p1  ORF type:complete len:596 (+),score=69.25 gnl/TRDRNA2_/TRDRNA2_128955_c0_seq2:240-1790(+)
MACLVGKFFRDILRRRVEYQAYHLLGGVIPFAQLAAPLSPPPGPDLLQRHQVYVVRTAKHTGERLSESAPLSWDSKPYPRSPLDGEATVVVQTSVRFQTFMGFGGSFTESSADLFAKLSSVNKRLVSDAYFNNATGLGYRLGRLHMNSCDFSTGKWSCDESWADEDLVNFSTAHYEATMLPMIREAQAAAGVPLTLLASPWSPPAWMKTTFSMLSGGSLIPSYRAAWAKFYVLFAERLKAVGVPLWGFTVQNEPGATTPWENCLYTDEEERDFVRDYLGPALNASGLDLKLLVHDHNRDQMFARARTIYSDPVAASYVWGVAYHWYGDPRYEFWPSPHGMVLHDNLRHVHELKPDKHIIMTEACQEMGAHIGSWELGERYAESIVRDLNNWLEAWIDWNLLLDTQGGPNHVGNFVSAPVLVDVERDQLLFLSSYYYIAHFSRYIKPGARRVLAGASRDALEVQWAQPADRQVDSYRLQQPGRVSRRCCSEPGRVGAAFLACGRWQARCHECAGTLH